MPKEVQARIGYALYVAQCGGRHRDAKPLKGFGGAGVLEIVADHRGDAFRGIYTIKFADAVYVLHAFQKKSRAGIATSKSDVELIRRRLRDAETISRGQQ
jgi:phage-related protein